LVGVGSLITVINIGGWMIAESFMFYQRDISKQKVLTKKEEDELFIQYFNGNKKAKEKIILGHSKFVLQIAYYYFNKGLPNSDVVSEGMIGLSRAVDRYEIARGYKFISYAKLYVQGFILKAIHEKGNLIKIPQKKLTILNNFLKIQYNDQVEMSGEISHLFNIKDQNSVSLNEKMYDMIMEEIIENPNGENPENLFCEKTNVNMIKDMMGELTDMEREILEKRYGLNGYRPYTYEQLSTEYNISIKQVKHFIEQSINFIQNHDKINNFKEMYEEYKEILDEQNYLQNKTHAYRTIQ